jgi:hypothetical protein
MRLSILFQTELGSNKEEPEADILNARSFKTSLIYNPLFTINKKRNSTFKKDKNCTSVSLV